MSSEISDDDLVDFDKVPGRMLRTHHVPSNTIVTMIMCGGLLLSAAWVLVADGSPAVLFALLATAVFRLLHLAGDQYFLVQFEDRLDAIGHIEHPPSYYENSSSFLVAAPATVLGLLAVFGDGESPSAPIRLGAASLTIAILAGLLFQLSPHIPRLPVRRQGPILLPVNLSMYSMVLGISSLGGAIIFGELG